MTRSPESKVRHSISKLERLIIARQAYYLIMPRKQSSPSPQALSHLSDEEAGDEAKKRSSSTEYLSSTR